MKNMEIKYDRQQDTQSEYVGYENPKLTLNDNQITLREKQPDAIGDGIIDIKTITLSPQDILKLMTWLVGQEKHKQK